MTIVDETVRKTKQEPARRRVGHGAALKAIERNTVAMELPGVGSVHLPPPEVLAWYGGLVVLGALGVIEWPVSIALGAGHLLAHNAHMKLLRGFGEALEEA